MALSDAEAAEELTQDNLRRAGALIEKGLQPAAWNQAVGAIQQDAFIGCVLRLLGGVDAVDAFTLEMQGRLSHWLDEAEKQVEAAVTRHKLVVANGKVPRA